MRLLGLVHRSEDDGLPQKQPLPTGYRLATTGEQSVQFLSELFAEETVDEEVDGRVGRYHQVADVIEPAVVAARLTTLLVYDEIEDLVDGGGGLTDNERDDDDDHNERYVILLCGRMPDQGLATPLGAFQFLHQVYVEDDQNAERK